MSRPDRRLRRMVLQLSSMDHHDRVAILQDIDPPQRAHLQKLLDELESPRGSAEPVATKIEAKELPPGISPWLVEKLGLAVDGASAVRDDHSITVHAREALQACVRELNPPPPSSDRQAVSWLAELFRRFAINRGARI